LVRIEELVHRFASVQNTLIQEFEKVLNDLFNEKNKFNRELKRARREWKAEGRKRAEEYTSLGIELRELNLEKDHKIHKKLEKLIQDEKMVAGRSAVMIKEEAQERRYLGAALHKNEEEIKIIESILNFVREKVKIKEMMSAVEINELYRKVIELDKNIQEKTADAQAAEKINKEQEDLNRQIARLDRRKQKLWNVVQGMKQKDLGEQERAMNKGKGFNVEGEPSKIGEKGKKFDSKGKQLEFNFK
jgi:hypothetical protein